MQISASCRARSAMQLDDRHSVRTGGPYGPVVEFISWFEELHRPPGELPPAANRGREGRGQTAQQKEPSVEGDDFSLLKAPLTRGCSECRPRLLGMLAGAAGNAGRGTVCVTRSGAPRVLKKLAPDEPPPLSGRPCLHSWLQKCVGLVPGLLRYEGFDFL